MKEKAGLKLFDAMKLIIFLIIGIIGFAFYSLNYDLNSEWRKDYYRNYYLQSVAWKRKRYVVLKRDNWRCVYCGARATQVHHLKYARDIGKEPIEWLVSVCNHCHNSKHRPVHKKRDWQL